MSTRGAIGASHCDGALSATHCSGAAQSRGYQQAAAHGVHGFLCGEPLQSAVSCGRYYSATTQQEGARVTYLVGFVVFAGIFWYLGIWPFNGSTGLPSRLTDRGKQ
jgi:hypothetical protein